MIQFVKPIIFFSWFFFSAFNSWSYSEKKMGAWHFQGTPRSVNEVLVHSQEFKAKDLPVQQIFESGSSMDRDQAVIAIHSTLLVDIDFNQVIQPMLWTNESMMKLVPRSRLQMISEFVSRATYQLSGPATLFVSEIQCDLYQKIFNQNIPSSELNSVVQTWIGPRNQTPPTFQVVQRCVRYSGVFQESLQTLVFKPLASGKVLLEAKTMMAMNSDFYNMVDSIPFVSAYKQTQSSYLGEVFELKTAMEKAFKGSLR